MHNRFLWLTLAILWCLSIFIVSGSPSATGGSTQALLKHIFKLTEEQAALVNLLFRKGVHLTAFGFLAFLFFMSFEKRRYVLAWLLTTLYAATDEWRQVFLPNRDGTVVDVVLDSLGAIIALSLIKLFTRRRLPSKGILQYKGERN